MHVLGKQTQLVGDAGREREKNPRNESEGRKRTFAGKRWPPYWHPLGAVKFKSDCIIM